MLATPSPWVYLFLDFDGVLHRFFPIQGETDASNAHFAYRSAFESAVRDCTRPVRIVVASTWRRKHDLQALRAFFSPAIAALIVGVTPQVGLGNGPAGRRVEVLQWLADHDQQGAEWVGVDDHPELYAPGDAVVVCHDRFGVRERDLLIEAVRDPSAFALRHPVPPPACTLRTAGSASTP